MSNAFDSTEYPTTEPDVLVIGDRWLWKRCDLTDYPTADYALSYRALQRGGDGANAKITISATESGSEYLVEVASTTTADYTPGRYAWQAYITRSSDSERIRIGEGTWTLAHDYLLGVEDPRTDAERMRDKARAAYETLVARSQQSYSIGQRSVTLRAVDEARREWVRWEHRVAQESNAQRVRGGRASVNNVRVRF